MAPDVRIGDVWSSTTGRNIVRVERIDTWDNVEWRRLAKDGAPSNQTGKCGLHNFPTNRRLVERSGVRIGGIRVDGGARYRVTGITGDRCDVEGAGGSEDLALATVATWGTV